MIMRYKQRPFKTSRHKSVTLLNDTPQTSFEYSSDRQHQHSMAHVAIIDNKTDHYDDDAHQSTYNLRDTDTDSALNLKQYHHVRHMNDVMRLAFLENNDISPEVWANIDFNSSTARILQRNIQQQLEWNASHASTPIRHARAPKNLPESVRQSSIHNNHKHQLQQLHRQHQQQQRQQQHQQQQHKQQEQLIQLQQHHQQQQQLLLQEQHQHQQHKQQQQNQQLKQNNHRTQHNHEQHQHHKQQQLRQQQQQQQQQLQFTHRAPSPRVTRKSHALLQQQNKQSRNQISATKLQNQEHQLTVPSSAVKQESSSGEFPCDEPGCGKFFPSLRKLRHHKVVHSNEFPYECQFKGCDKRFKRKFGIDLHSTTHFDLDPDMYTRTSNNSSMQIFGRRMQYSVCKQCDAKFKTVHEYQVHMLAHGKEPFKCLVKGCGQSFSIWKSFQKHRASHYFNYYCQMDPQCDHHTSNLQLLKLHIYCCHFNRKLPENAKPTTRDHE